MYLYISNNNCIYNIPSNSSFQFNSLVKYLSVLYEHCIRNSFIVMAPVLNNAVAFLMRCEFKTYLNFTFLVVGNPADN